MLTECPVMGLLGRRENGAFPLTHYEKSAENGEFGFYCRIVYGCLSCGEASLSVLALRLIYDKAEYFIARIKRAHDSVIAFRAPRDLRPTSPASLDLTSRNCAAFDPAQIMPRTFRRNRPPRNDTPGVESGDANRRR